MKKITDEIATEILQRTRDQIESTRAPAYIHFLELINEYRAEIIANPTKEMQYEIKRLHEKSGYTIEQATSKVIIWAVNQKWNGTDAIRIGRALLRPQIPYHSRGIRRAQDEITDILKELWKKADKI